jgi:hypothetical protein
MDEYEYMWAPTKHIPPATMAKYNLTGLVSNGRVLIDMGYGKLACWPSNANLATHGYHQAANTPTSSHTRPATLVRPSGR